MLKKKEDDTLRRIEETKQAARDAAKNFATAKELKFNQYHASAKGNTNLMSDTVVHNPGAMNVAG